MIRSKAVEGGRQIKNEDLIRYIQAFTLLENWFDELGLGDFILYGCEVSGTAITDGVIYLDGELCVFDAVSGITTPYTVSKSVVDSDARTFASGDTKYSAEIIKAVYDELGSFSISANTKRGTDRFLRNIDNELKGEINTNNGSATNFRTENLTELAGLSRRIPQPEGTGRYLKFGSFPTGLTKAYTFLISGISGNRGGSILLNVEGLKSGGTNLSTNCTATFINYNEAENNRPTFYVKIDTLNSIWEVWAKTQTSLSSGDLLFGSITQVGDAYTEEAAFTFEDSFSWTATVPTSLLAIDEKLLVFKDETDALDDRLTVVEDALEDVINVEPVDLIAGSNVTILNSSVSVKSGVVMVTARYSSTENSAGGTTVLTIPSSIAAPSNRVDIAAVNYSSDEYDGMQLYLASGSRAIKITDTGRDDLDYSFSFSYGIF